MRRPVGRSSAPTEVPDDGVATPAPAPIPAPIPAPVPTSKPAPSPGCEHRPGGALIDLEIKDRDGTRPAEHLTIWSTSPKFIEEAARLAESGERRVPVFERVVDGADCDAQYSWHVDPGDMSFVDASTEVCDAEPSFVEEVKDHWISAVGRYCPWNAKIVGVR